MRNDFDAVRAEIERAGGLTTVRKRNDVTQLICASQRRSDGNGLGGNSFWLGRDGRGRWFLVTWLERAWAIPEGAPPREIGRLCRATLDAATAPIYEVPLEIVNRFSLAEHSGDPFA